MNCKIYLESLIKVSKKMKFLKYLLIAVLLTPNHSLSAPKKFIINGSYYDWTVYENKDDNNKECYITSFAINKFGSHKTKRISYITVTLFKNSKIQEFSINNGLDYELNGTIFLKINN